MIDNVNSTDTTKQADALDTVRYYCDHFFKWFLKAYDATTPEVKEPTTAPELAPASRQVIYALEIGDSVTCTREEYFSTVRADILNQVAAWFNSGKT